ncbi:M24 family metallopeptidase [Arthrobacter sp. JUb115]|uniref:M24 family metallopeptidase n=1 Tax=Arthrobacter sp. JUb115 TaxID=2485108 RepID=UPI0025703A37|nr:M24 family metallopeptidase [Arthrobacter sp. JUb115]
MQAIARETMKVAQQSIRPGQNLTAVRELCEQTMLSLGADSFWYWGIGAFVFCGTDTIQSVPGKSYKTADRVIQAEDIITIDLSPQRNEIWGDFARTIIVENGEPLQESKLTKRQEWREGILAEEQLHAALIGVARPAMTFEELHTRMNAHILELGFENIDFLGNLGHSIERKSADRVYIEPGNTLRLDEVELFTFEPHIRRPNGDFGFKHENIYQFNGAVLAEI